MLHLEICQLFAFFQVHHEEKSPVSYAFLQLTSDETSILAWKWISGEPLYSEQRRELKVASNIDKDEKALQAFMGLKNVLQLIHFKLILLLLDEFESIEILTNIKKQKLLNSIRHLIDLNPLGPVSYTHLTLPTN